MRKKLYDEFVRDCGSSCINEYVTWLEDRIFLLEVRVENFKATNKQSTPFIEECPGCGIELGDGNKHWGDCKYR